VTAVFEPAQHPRHPAGSEQGGEFASKSAPVAEMLDPLDWDGMALRAEVMKWPDETNEQISARNTAFAAIANAESTPGMNLWTVHQDGELLGVMSGEFTEAGILYGGYAGARGGAGLLLFKQALVDAADNSSGFEWSGTQRSAPLYAKMGIPERDEDQVYVLDADEVRELSRDIFAFARKKRIRDKASLAARAARYAKEDAALAAAANEMFEWPEYWEMLPAKRTLAAAAVFDSTKHPRHPAGSEEGGEFAAKGADQWQPFPIPKAAELPHGFPPGEFDPEGKVKYWPADMGAYSGFIQDAPYGPFWKAMVDRGTGEEVAFWFVNDSGYPHHVNMRGALGLDDQRRLGYASGYGQKGEIDWLHGRPGFHKSRSEEDWAVTAERAIVARHRRDIRDANAMLPEKEQSRALAAAAFEEDKHPRHPAGSEQGGEFAPKLALADGPTAFEPKAARTTGQGLFKANDPYRGFPAGEFDPEDSTKFWPDRIGTDPRYQDEPFWKALLDQDGKELAFWFVDGGGFPHHQDMLHALYGPRLPPGTGQLAQIAGFGSNVDRAPALIQARYLKHGDSMEEQRAYMQTFDETPLRHRRDLKDAHIMIPMQHQRAFAASALNMESDAILQATDRLRLQYEKVYRRAAKRSAAAYREEMKVLQAAAQPPIGSVIAAKILLESFLSLTGVARRDLLKQILDALHIVHAGVQLQPGDQGDDQGDQGDQGVPSSEALLSYLDLLHDQTGVQAARLVAGSQDAVADVLLQAMAEGWPVPQTAKAIQTKLESVAPWQATMLARTDLIALGNGASLQRAVVLNDPGSAFKTWLATPDERTRINHRHAHGQTVPTNQPFNVGGEQLLYPGDPSASDGNVINCRCTIIYGPSAFGPEGIKQIAMLPDLAVSAAGWDEAKHPREPEGSEKGGQFAPLYHFSPIENRASIAEKGLIPGKKGYVFLTDDPKSMRGNEDIFDEYVITQPPEGVIPDPTGDAQSYDAPGWKAYKGTIPPNRISRAGRPLAAPEYGDQFAALQLYTQNSFDLNAALRGERPLSQYQAETVAQLDRLIDEHGETSPSDDMTVYRGVGPRGGGQDHWTEPGYLSATEVRDTAWDFAGDEDSRILEIKVPEGQRFYRVPEGAYEYNQHEVIFPRGTEFRLEKDGTYTALSHLQKPDLPPVQAAAWDESKHARHPKGDEAGGEFASRMEEQPPREGPPPGFPAGEFDPKGKVKFWPQGGIAEFEDYPVWKAIMDRDGKELAFWFVDQKGMPHHHDMSRALGVLSQFDEGESSKRTALVAGYGILVDSAIPTWWKDRPDATILRQQAVEIAIKHRKDIEDAEMMMSGPIAAGAWQEEEHPRDPGGEGGGEFIAKGAPGDGLTDEAAAAALEANYDDWAAGLSQAQKDAFQAWRSEVYYSDMNNMMRQDPADLQMDDWDKVYGYTETFRQMMFDAPRVATPVRVSRGVDAATLLQAAGASSPEELVGKTLYDDGFRATTTVAGLEDQFGDSTIEITVPKGYPAIWAGSVEKAINPNWLDELEDWERPAYNSELVLAPGGFKVSKVRRDRMGRLILQAEAVDPW
jgi:hypothetical protein